MKKIILSGLLLASLVSCQSDDAATTNNPNSSPVQFVNVKQDMLSGDEVAAGNYVVKTGEQWEALKATLNAAYQEDIDALEGIEVDFTAYDVIAAVDQWYPNGGHAVSISAIASRNNTITVSVEATGEGDATTVVVQPFHIVKIPKTTLPIVFE